MAVVFVPKEDGAERRVAAVPDTVRRLRRDGHEVRVERGAGARAHVHDAEFEQAGATLTDDATSGFESADVVLQVAVPTVERVRRLRPGASFVSFLWPLEHLDVVRALAAGRVDAFALDLLPRSTRAQKSDALTSQASLAGYRAVVLAAAHLPRVFPMQMTPAGTLRPARVVVLGAGVAGLQAIATARRLGAIVEATDVRPEVKEQVQSLGAVWIETPGATASGAGGYASELGEEAKQRQAEAIRARVVAADVVVTTALVPYRPAPRLVTAATVAAMRPGSVIVDLAAERGGNVEGTVPGRIVVCDGVTIVGLTDLAASVSNHASEQYARNVQSVVSDATKKGTFAWDVADEVVAAALVVHAGTVRHGPTRAALGLPAEAAPVPEPGPAPIARADEPLDLPPAAASPPGSP